MPAMNVTLKKGIALMGFVANYNKVDVVPFTDKETGEEYHRLVCEDEFGTRTFVNMSSKLGEVKGKSTKEVASYIRDNAKNLQVVPTEERNTLILCKLGGDFKGAERVF